jgi:hypothetical protein
MSYLERLSTKDHIKNARYVNDIEERLRKLFGVCADSYGYSHKLTRRMLSIQNKFEEAKWLLEDEYEKDATDDELVKYRRVYLRKEKV